MRHHLSGALDHRRKCVERKRCLLVRLDFRESGEVERVEGFKGKRGAVAEHGCRGFIGFDAYCHIGKVLDDVAEEFGRNHRFARFFHHSKTGDLDGKLKVGGLKGDAAIFCFQVNTSKDGKR